MKTGKMVLGILVVAAGLVFFAEKGFSSEVKSDPSMIWLSPLGTDDIENTAKNRCLLIKKVKPGAVYATATNQNVHELLKEYATSLYAHATKVSAQLEEETALEKTKTNESVEDELTILKRKIIDRLAGTARRINTINSLEAGTNMLNSLLEMTAQGNEVYAEINCDEL